MNIALAKKEDIQGISDIIKERCDWFQKNGINQWRGSYSVKYGVNYFIEAMQIHKLYTVKQEDKLIGVFLLKEEDKAHWDNDENSYFIHHLVTKIGYPGVGAKIIKYIEKIAKDNSKKFIRLDCKKSNIALNKYYEKLGFVYKGSGEIYKGKNIEPYIYNLWEKEIL